MPNDCSNLRGQGILLAPVSSQRVRLLVTNRIQYGCVIRSIVVLSVGVFLLGCATMHHEKDQIEDPFEGFNRAMFSFNDTLDIYLMEPVARGYDYVVPNIVQDGVSNVFENLGYPRYLVSSLVQGKFSQAMRHTGRFAINSTVGLAGIVDVAQHVGLQKHEEDFGLAMAHYNLPAGPYLVLPILGPTNFRDGVGTIVDTALDPLYWINYTDKINSSDRFWISSGATVLKFVNRRADLLDAVETAKESSLDYYLFIQGAYYQYRAGILEDKFKDSYFEENVDGAKSESSDEWWDDDEDVLKDEDEVEGEPRAQLQQQTEVKGIVAAERSNTKNTPTEQEVDLY